VFSRQPRLIPLGNGFAHAHADAQEVGLDEWWERGRACACVVANGAGEE
jgi:hypothetical protein